MTMGFFSTGASDTRTCITWSAAFNFGCFALCQKCSRKDDVDSRELDQRKTLQAQTVGKSSEENNEFEKQRTAAIAEVAKTKEVCLIHIMGQRFAS